MNAKGKSIWLVLLGISLGLNVWLLIRWANMKPPEKPAIVSPNDALTQKEFITSTQAPVRVAKQPFEWVMLESTSYPQYATNLRNFGCPEPVVKTILQRDIYAYYLDLRSKELAPFLVSFWDLATNDFDDSRAIVRADVKDAETTVDSLLEQLLHTRREDPFLTRVRRRTAKRNDVRLGFLPPETRAQLIRIEKQDDETNSISKDQQIAQLLNPVELQEYRLRSSPANRSLLNTSYIDAQPAALKEIIARYCSDSPPKDDIDRPKLKEDIRAVLGDQAAQIFELSYLRNFRSLYAVADQAHRDPSAAIALYTIQQDMKNKLAAQPDSAAAIIAEGRRLVSQQVGPEQTQLLFDQLNFPNL